MALSALAIKAAKGTEKPFKLTDSDGLYLLVTPSGNRYWRMNYRFAVTQETLAFGVWPYTGLADARAKRDNAQIDQSKSPTGLAMAITLIIGII